MPPAPFDPSDHGSVRDRDAARPHRRHDVPVLEHDAVGPLDHDDVGVPRVGQHEPGPGRVDRRPVRRRDVGAEVERVRGRPDALRGPYPGIAEIAPHRVRGEERLDRPAVRKRARREHSEDDADSIVPGRVAHGLRAQIDGDGGPSTRLRARRDVDLKRRATARPELADDIRPGRDGAGHVLSARAVADGVAAPGTGAAKGERVLRVAAVRHPQDECLRRARCRRQPQRLLPRRSVDAGADEGRAPFETDRQVGLEAGEVPCQSGSRSAPGSFETAC